MVTTVRERNLLIHFESDGPSTGPPTVLLHGFAMDSASNWVSTGWTRRLLAAGRRVILIDLLGHGRSDKPHSASDYDRRVMGEDVLEVLDVLKIQAFDCVGFSMGARIALEVLAAAQYSVRRAVLGGVGHFLPEAGAQALAARLLGSDSIQDSRIDHAYELAMAAAAQNDAAALGFCLLGPHQELTEAVLGTITADVLVAVGDRDPLQPEAAGIAKQLPKGAFVSIPGLSHNNLCISDRFKLLAIEHISGAIS